MWQLACINVYQKTVARPLQIVISRNVYFHCILRSVLTRSRMHFDHFVRLFHANAAQPWGCIKSPPRRAGFFPLPFLYTSAPSAPKDNNSHSMFLCVITSLYTSDVVSVHLLYIKIFRSSRACFHLLHTCQIKFKRCKPKFDVPLVEKLGDILWIFYLPSIYQNGYSDYACVCLSSRNQNSNLCNLTFQQTLLVMYSKTDKEIEYLALSSRVQKGSKLSIRL